MEVKINKEIRNYTESIFFGLTLRQCVFSILGCIVAIIVYFIFNSKVGTEITTWICMLSVVPFALFGFVSYQGMNAEQIIKVACRSFILSRQHLIFRPLNLYYECVVNSIEKHKKEALKKDDKKLRKNQKTKQGKI